MLQLGPQVLAGDRPDASHMTGIFDSRSKFFWQRRQLVRWHAKKNYYAALSRHKAEWSGIEENCGSDVLLVREIVLFDNVSVSNNRFQH